MYPRSSFLWLSLLAASATLVTLDLWASAQSRMRSQRILSNPLVMVQTSNSQRLIAQTVEDRKAEADRLLQQGIQLIPNQSISRSLTVL